MSQPKPRGLKYYWVEGLWLLHLVSRAVVGAISIGAMRVLRRLDRKRMARVTGPLLRRLGPLFPEHRVGRANLTAAFPEKSPAEINTILAGVWENLGRFGAEFMHLDQFTISKDKTGDADALCDDATMARIDELLHTPGPRLIFAAHLANWELGARFAHNFSLDNTVLYRPPNIRAIREEILRLRAECMGTLVPSGFDAPIRLAGALGRGSKVGMLVDQHDVRGIEVTFFGRPCKVSPLLARLARHFDCPIHGLRMIRIADGNKFRGELTEPIEPMRGADGRIDVQGTTQKITSIVETWVREHPEQWLWVHRLWR